MDTASLSSDELGRVVGFKKNLDGVGILPENGISGSIFTDTEGKGSLFTIKERLAMLDGVFPMDEAVVEGNVAP